MGEDNISSALAVSTDKSRIAYSMRSSRIKFFDAVFDNVGQMSAVVGESSSQFFRLNICRMLLYISEDRNIFLFLLETVLLWKLCVCSCCSLA